MAKKNKKKLKNSKNGNHQRRLQQKSYLLYFFFEETAQKGERFITRRQVAWMIYENFNVSDTDEPVLDLKVELKNDNVQTFNMRWSETITAMMKQQDDDNLKTFYRCQRRQSEQPKKLLSLFIRDTVQKRDSRWCQTAKYGGPRLEQTIREKHFSSRESQLEKIRFWRRCCSHGKSRTKEKDKGQWSLGEKCVMKHDSVKRCESKGEGKGSRASSPGRYSLGNAARQVRGLSGKKKPTCHAFKKGECSKGNACDLWHPLECSYHQKKRNCKVVIDVWFQAILERLRANQRRELILWQSPEHWTSPQQGKNWLR